GADCRSRHTRRIDGTQRLVRQTLRTAIPRNTRAQWSNRRFVSTPIPFTARRIPHTATHNRIVSGTRQLLASAISLYLLALVIHLVLRLVLEDRFRLLAVANLITPFYFLPLVVVIPLALVAGMRRIALAAGILALVGVI